MNRFPDCDESVLDVMVRDARGGVSEAETRIHQVFVDRLIRLASQRINKRFRSKIDADEVVQSVFASFFGRHAQGDFQFEAWSDIWVLLVKITVRKCSSRVAGFMTAKRDVSRERCLEGDRDWDPVPIVGREPRPDEIALFNDSLDQLFDGLTPLQQQIVTLRLEGCSNVEISHKVGRTERTVYRSLEKVQAVFESLQ